MSLHGRAVIYGAVEIIRILPQKSKFEMPDLRREIRQTTTRQAR